MNIEPYRLTGWFSRTIRELFILTLLPICAGAAPAPGGDSIDSIAQTLAAVPACVPAPTGMVGWWPGEENGNDVVGGNHATLRRTSFRPGQVGQAFHFAAVDSQMTIPAHPLLDVGAGNGLTIEMWFNPASSSTRSLLEWFRSGLPQEVRGVYLGQNNAGPFSYLVAHLRDVNGTTHSISSSAALTTSLYHHIALTYDKATRVAKIYQNGAIVAQQNVGVLTPQTSYELVLGRQQTILGPGSLGLIDELSIYNRALGDAEIAAVFGAGSAGKCATPIPPNVMIQPQPRTAISGSPVTFSVAAIGTAPLMYQWQFNDLAIHAATNALLTLPAITTNDAGVYSVVVSSAAGSTYSSNAALSVIEVVGNDFQVLNLSSNNSILSRNGYGRYGIAASESRVFSSDVFFTTGFLLDDLNRGGTLAQFYALVSNLKTETVYSLGNGIYPINYGGGLVTSLIELKGTDLTRTGVIIPLSRSLILSNDTGVFSGFGRIALHNGERLYDIIMPSGIVTDLGPVTLPPHARVSWAYWGVSEYFGGAVHLVYVRDPQSIVRTRVPDGLTTEVSRFINLRDMASFTVSLTRGLWCFSYSAFSQFSSFNSGLGLAQGSFALNLPLASPMITVHPVSKVTRPGGDAAFSVVAFGGPPLTYQWQFEGDDLPGATNATLSITNVGPSNLGAYSVMVANAFGAAASAPATLTTALSPAITAQPRDAATNAGGAVSFSVSATGATPLSYQWQQNGNDIQGARQASLTLTNLTPSDAGDYTVTITNLVGSVTSRPASLIVRTIDLGTALDTGQRLVWTNGGESAWFGQSKVTYDGIDAAQGRPVASSTTSWIETAVTGPGLLLFWWKFESSGSYGQLHFFTDGEFKAGSYADVGWRQREFVIPAGRHTLRWEVTSGSSTGPSQPGAWLDQVRFIAGRTTPIALPLDAELVQNAQDSPANWFEQTQVTHDGISAAQSGNINDGEQSAASALVAGPGTVAFWWKVSSEKDFDGLIFQIDDLDQARISGNVHWQRKVIYVPEYDHVLTWRYAKDESVSEGEDAGWVDQVAFTPERPPIITIRPASRSVFEGETVVLRAAAVGRPPLSYEWLFGAGVSYGEILKLSNVGFQNAGDYVVVIRNAAGEARSAPARLVVKPRIAHQIAIAGAHVTFTLNTARLNARSYEWFFNGEAMADGPRVHGVRRATLRIMSVKPEDSGYYGADGVEQIHRAYLSVLPRGSVVAFGANFYGEARVPVGLSDVIAVAASSSHSLALKGDGTVVAWGNNYSGQANPPPDLSNVVAIAAGGGHSLALRGDGKVVAWGYNNSGQATVPAELSDVIAIAAAGARSLALKRDGTVVAWGRDDNGQVIAPEGLSNVIAIAAGGTHNLVLKADRTVAGWGSNDYGQINIPSRLGDVIAIAAGESHSLALKRNGTVVAWGANSPNSILPGQVTTPPGLQGVIAIAAGDSYSMALRRDGKVIFWSWHPGQFVESITPVGLTRVVAIAAQGYNRLALIFDPVITADPVSQAVTPGENATFTVAATGREPMLFQWRFKGAVILGATNSSLTLSAVEPGDAGNYNVLVRNAFGHALSATANLTVSTPTPLQAREPGR